MRIGVISDTHDKVENALRAVDDICDAGAYIVVHCGDWKTPVSLMAVADKCVKNDIRLYTVLGNNDTDREKFIAVAESLGSDGIVLIDGIMEVPADNDLRVVAYHGHHAPTLRCLRSDDSIDVLLLGHTHKPKIEDAGGQLIVNPGSLAFSIPRSKEWRPSYAIVDLDARTALIKYLQ